MGFGKASVKRSEQILEMLAQSGEITEAGKNWIIAAFDPFHDSDQNCTGYPDAVNQESIMQMVTTSFTVVSPNTTANFDCHIVQFPYLGTITTNKPAFFPYTAPGDSTGAVTPASFSQSGDLTNGNIGGGGVQAYLTLTSADNNDIFVGTIIAQFGTTLPNQYLQNPYRVIGLGFEVYNTTADLFKSGAVVCYRQPVQNYRTSTSALVFDNTGSGNAGYPNVCIMEAPPSTPAEALLLTNARQWDAKEGCYVISPMHSIINDTNLGNFTQPFYYRNTPGDTNYWGAGLSAGGPSSNFAVFANNNFINFDQTGAIFTGLTPQTNLTVNVRWFVESFPSSGSLLQTLAKPSPMYDPIALELYAKIVYRSPVAVEVKFNGLGDWFNDAISSISNTVLPVVRSIAGNAPMVKMLTSGLGGKKKKKKPK